METEILGGLWVLAVHSHTTAKTARTAKNLTEAVVCSAVVVTKNALRLLPFLLAVVLSGCAYYFGTGLDPVGGLVWFAPLPVLIAAFDLGPGKAALLAFAAYLAGGLNMVSYLGQIVPMFVLALSIVIPALAFALAVLLARRAARVLPAAFAVLAFPSAWTAYEYGLSAASPHGTAGSIAYSQESLSLLQIASATGIWGIVFVLTLIPASLAVALHRRARSALAFALVALGITVGYGWFRLSNPKTPRPLRVGLAVTDTTVKHFDTVRREEAIPVLEAYARRVGELRSRGAQIVVLPEKFVGIAEGYSTDATRILGAAATDAGVTLIAGVNRVDIRPMRNLALVFGPDGRLLLEYDKVHLLPGPESGYLAGTGTAIFEVEGVTAGVAICKDLDFPELGRRYSAAGTGILFVPAWDFVRDEQLHARMAVMRGIEGGFSVVRSAQQGLATVADHFGRVLASESSSAGSEVLLTADVAPGPGHTLYSRVGDWFAWLNLVLLGMIVAGVMRRRDA
jgi:apolipoprotein N-acyltransferase